MNISTYLPDHLLGTLDHLAKERQLSRSAVIREALEAYLARFERGAWPDEVMMWDGDPEFPPFEATRGTDAGTGDPFEASASQ